MAPFLYEVVYLQVTASGATLAAVRSNLHAAYSTGKGADPNTDFCRCEAVFYKYPNGQYGGTATWYETHHAADQLSKW